MREIPLRRNVVIVIPTYNEAENIQLLLQNIRQCTQDGTHVVSILIVDDNSPDGTAQHVRKYQLQDPDVHLLCGRKEGLGAAYIRGMRYALDILHADIIMEMDADFSHAPEDIPKLLQEIEEGYDFVIGSRYVQGGSIPLNWGWARKVNSRFGNIVARWIGGIRNVRDCTAGFRAIRARTLKSIDFLSLKARGYVFQVILLRRCLEEGAKVKEVPVHFVDRTRGTTKLGLQDIIEFLWRIWSIRLRTLNMFCAFCVVGLSGVFVNLAVFYILLRNGIHEYMASPIAVELSILSNFILNNTFTFSSLPGARSFIGKLLRFNIASLLGLCATWLTFVLLTKMMGDLSPLTRQALAILPGVCINYLLYSRWVFGNLRARNVLSRILKH